ncbi:homologue of bacterial MinE 1 [Striga asiatica]|uniref:Homologue of bacterial MinE 1 n=1 Tax=Striga asiatica TaxID=4170 RepID=A0A5A7QAM3_STRAF|nr:homologue of bacterial MinE 1 [Striga asiatica]
MKILGYEKFNNKSPNLCNPQKRRDSREYQIAVEVEVDGRYKPRRQRSGGAASGVGEEDDNKSRAPPGSAWWSDERRRWIVGDVIADMADLVGVDQLEAVVVATGPTAAVGTQQYADGVVRRW